VFVRRDLRSLDLHHRSSHEAHLQNLVEMTGHRDHLRLEVSVLSTLQKLSAITKCEPWKCSPTTASHPRAPAHLVQDGALVSTEAGSRQRPAREPLARITLPCRNACEPTRNPGPGQHAQGAHTLWLPVWMHDKVSTCLEITQSRPFSPTSSM
jgi:hypothetical protein